MVHQKRADVNNEYPRVGPVSRVVTAIGLWETHAYRPARRERATDEKDSQGNAHTGRRPSDGARIDERRITANDGIRRHFAAWAAILALHVDRVSTARRS